MHCSTYPEPGDVVYRDKQGSIAEVVQRSESLGQPGEESCAVHKSALDRTAGRCTARRQKVCTRRSAGVDGARLGKDRQARNGLWTGLAVEDATDYVLCEE